LKKFRDIQPRNWPACIRRFFAGSEKKMTAEKFREVLEYRKTGLEAYLQTKTGNMIPHPLTYSMIQIFD
jgi:hypothetical protein